MCREPHPKLFPDAAVPKDEPALFVVREREEHVAESPRDRSWSSASRRSGEPFRCVCTSPVARSRK
jgi:hypothetical protein